MLHWHTVEDQTIFDSSSRIAQGTQKWASKLQDFSRVHHLLELLVENLLVQSHFALQAFQLGRAVIAHLMWGSRGSA